MFTPRDQLPSSRPTSVPSCEARHVTLTSLVPLRTQRPKTASCTRTSMFLTDLTVTLGTVPEVHFKDGSAVERRLRRALHPTFSDGHRLVHAVARHELSDALSIGAPEAVHREDMVDMRTFVVKLEGVRAHNRSNHG